MAAMQAASRLRATPPARPGDENATGDHESVNGAPTGCENGNGEVKIDRVLLPALLEQALDDYREKLPAGFFKRVSGMLREVKETDEASDLRQAEADYAYDMDRLAFRRQLAERDALLRRWVDGRSDVRELVAECEALLAGDTPVEAEPQLTGHDQLWAWFGLSYAAWLAIPRTLMHAMPDDWQRQMAALLSQWDEAWDTGGLPSAVVTGVRNNRFVAWPRWLIDYRHPDHAEVEALRRQPVKLGGGEVSND